MAAIVTAAGMARLLDAATGKHPASLNWTLRLFVNDHQPIASDDTSAFVEAAGGGYAAAQVDGAGWSAAAGFPASTQRAKIAFVFSGALSGGKTIYGYYVVDGDGVVIAAERLLAAFTPANASDFVNVLLSLAFREIG